MIPSGAIRVLEFDLDHKHNDESKEALRMAIQALQTVSEIKKYIDFHKLNETPFDELSGFESFVIEQICEE